MINVNKIPNRIRDPVDSFNDEECAKVFFEILHFADDLSKSKGMYIQLFRVNVERLPDSEDEP